jgi:uncharacterized protein (DUF302 family)
VRVNHTDAGKRVGLDLRPTETLIFGNPAAGTHLMISQQEVALDLPLRMAAWLDEKGSVWLGGMNLLCSPSSTTSRIARKSWRR